MQGRATFVIAHRLSIIGRADQILVVEQGQIVEGGTHEELYALRGRYFDLYTKQHGLESNLFRLGEPYLQCNRSLRFFRTGRLYRIRPAWPHRFLGATVIRKRQRLYSAQRGLKDVRFLPGHGGEKISSKATPAAVEYLHILWPSVIGLWMAYSKPRRYLVVVGASWMQLLTCLDRWPGLPISALTVGNTLRKGWFRARNARKVYYRGNGKHSQSI